MTAILPNSFYRMKRGLCPGCGAPLDLDTDAATTRCGYCGNQAVLERRLRKAEPEVAGAPLRLYFDGESAEAALRPTETPWVRSARFRQSAVERAVCPGCGDSLECDDEVDAITCRSCGTDSRLERRLWLPPPDPATEVPRPRHPDERRRGNNPPDADPETEHLIYRIVHETDPDRRLVLAHKFEAWGYINATSARLLPALLAVLRDGDARLQYPIADLVSKLLCEGDKSLRNTVVRAAERFVFDLKGPRLLLYALGLGDGVCLKLLLDAAEYAVRKGDFEYACAALLAINWIFQRNFPDHRIMGEIILYRMLYLTGPVLAFAFLLAQRQVTGTGFYYPAETLLAFIDDCAAERKVLVEELNKSFYVGAPDGEGEYRRRRAFYETLRTDESRAAALRQYLWVPQEAPEAVYRDHFDFLLPLLDQPALKSAAEAAMEDAVRTPAKVPQAVHDLVRERGKALPAEMLRQYLMAVPDTKLVSFSDLPYWTPTPTPQLSSEFKQALDQWKDGLNRADDLNKQIRASFTEHWQTIKHLEVPIYDGKSDGPPPGKTAKELAEEAADSARPPPRTQEENLAIMRDLEAQTREMVRQMMEQAAKQKPGRGS